MYDVIPMQVAHSAQCLGEELKRLWLGECVLGVLVVEQVAHLGILHHHVDVIGVIKSVPDLDYVWMVDFRV